MADAASSPSLWDAHAHLQDEKLLPQLDQIAAAARAAGIKKIVCCGSAERDWPAVARVKTIYPQLVIASFGLHPWYLRARSRAWFKSLEDHLTRQPSAVGEIGLDFALTDFDPAEQKEVFSKQLALARRLQRSVSIHCRRAWEGLVEVLQGHGPLEQGGLIHSYSGSAELVPVLAEYNLSFSFSGSLTRSGNRRGHKAFLAVPPERLLIETDSPDLTPVGAQAPNVPANLLLVLRAAAKILDKSEAEIAQVTGDNAQRLFGRYA